MGTDKARLEVEGEPLAVRVVGRLGEVCERVLVASGDGQRLADLGLEEVADHPAGAGPLAGIVAGLVAADTPLVVVAAVDMPWVDPRIMVVLADRWQGEAAVVPLVDGRVEPLHGVYATSASGPFVRLLEGGKRGVTHALSTLGARVVGPEAWAHLDATGTFVRDLDRPEDLP